MAEQTLAFDESLTAITETELSHACGGASIYVDGNYWGEGELDLRPWPGGFPVVQRTSMRFI